MGVAICSATATQKQFDHERIMMANQTETDLVAVGETSGLQHVRITRDMADQRAELEMMSFPTADPVDLYNADELAVLAEEFPQGTVIGFDGPGRGQPVAAGLGLRVHFDFDDYFTEVRAGRLYDSTLSFQLENGFETLCALANYMTDPAVDSWASLIVWHNPNHRPSNSIEQDQHG